MAYDIALTTFDNPYDPFTQGEAWLMFDIEHGYNCCSRVGRLAKTSDALSDDENDAEIERAIDELIAVDVLNIYKKVKQFKQSA